MLTDGLTKEWKIGHLYRTLLQAGVIKTVRWVVLTRGAHSFNIAAEKWQVHNEEKVTKNKLTIIPKPHAHAHSYTMKKTHAKFQNDWLIVLIVLGFNNMSTLVGHVVLSPREKEIREIVEEMKERDREKRGTGVKGKKQKK